MQNAEEINKDYTWIFELKSKRAVKIRKDIEKKRRKKNAKKNNSYRFEGAL